MQELRRPSTALERRQTIKPRQINNRYSIISVVGVHKKFVFNSSVAREAWYSFDLIFLVELSIAKPLYRSVIEDKVCQTKS